MRILIGTLIFLCIVSACNLKPAIRGNEGSLESKSNSTEETIQSDQAVDFEGVSFHYDPRVFGDVTKQVVPQHNLENPNDSPDEVEPSHVLFTFGIVGKNAWITVFLLDGFDQAYEVSPDMRRAINKNIANVRKALQDLSFRVDRQIPDLWFSDASDDLYAKVRDFDFPGANGIIFVAHETDGLKLVSNSGLVYRFEGITNDGKYYVAAETPVSVAFLPDYPPKEFEGYMYENLYEGNSNSKVAQARIEKYRSSIATRLEKLDPSDYSPNLEKFEAIISSLKINK